MWTARRPRSGNFGADIAEAIGANPGRAEGDPGSRPRGSTIVRLAGRDPQRPKRGMGGRRRIGRRGTRVCRYALGLYHPCDAEIPCNDNGFDLLLEKVGE